MLPMFFTRTANPVKVSAVPGTGTGAVTKAEAHKDRPWPSGFSMGAHFAGSKAMEFGGTERETRSAPSY
jgi:hypothetical protein